MTLEPSARSPATADASFAADAPDPREPDGAPEVLLQTGLVLVRVSLVTAVWLAVFLLTFLGYLTVPAFLLAGFLLVWGSFRVLRRRR